ncbi:DUF2461 domain-containing protein [Nocardioides sp. ChNu-153]|uniref:DUF2461 domain-containing protein n=1 Tax=Nocardioides sp. ChNu-153 TaxID=2779364 RepID=UPI002656A66C|nr:DUF2461 domain-containing protein [Nocardioides sp. ChNu-153]MDN7120994.1 DUF2461 domain-containing protein [Nocardioides sp. ChNu-153]
MSSPTSPEPGPFTGFPEAALDFYDDLEVDNTRSFWLAHKEQYDASVRAPMLALTAALEDEFGAAKVFRPYRDVRFRTDKTPYKTHQGAFVAAGPSCGWYVQVSARGVRTGAGFYRADPPALARYRAYAADPDTGPLLAELVAAAEADGWERAGDRLKTAPRGFDASHPRIALLRHRSLSFGRDHGFEPAVIGVPAFAETVRRDWRSLRPLVEALAEVLDDPFGAEPA